MLKYTQDLLLRFFIGPVSVGGNIGIGPSSSESESIIGVGSEETRKKVFSKLCLLYFNRK